MKILNKIKILALLAPMALMTVGCTDVEDYPDGRLSRQDVFQNAKRVAGFLNNCYSYVGDSRLDNLSNNSMLASCSDEAHDVMDLRNGAPFQWVSGYASSYSNPISGYDWAYYYRAVNQCNIFLANIDNATVNREQDRIDYKAQAHGLRAFYYLQLIKKYGGVPIILKEITDDSEYSKIRRASFSECVRQIIADCRVVLQDDNKLSWFSGATNVESFRYQFSKGMACAIMSEAALYAASPLNNDGSFTWAEAEKVTKEALDLCVANGYSLFTRKPAADQGYSAYDLYFISRSDAGGVNDKETIMEARNQLSIWSYSGLPTVLGQSRAGTCPSQELVDSYETIDGKMPILGYKDAEHLQPIINPDATLYDEKNPYKNRDPRLQASIYYNGATEGVNSGALVDTKAGGNCEISSSSVRNTRTGYYLRKFCSPKSNRTSNQDGYYKVFRLAELFLNYAEAAGEAATGAVPEEAVEAVNLVRERVGMPDLPDGLSKDEFRTRVRNERRVEFAFEEQRFYDVRRWNILDQTDKVVTGMRPTDNGYERFVVSERVAYTSKYLRFPIPGDEAIRFKNYTGIDFQNAGW